MNRRHFCKSRVVRGLCAPSAHQAGARQTGALERFAQRHAPALESLEARICFSTYLVTSNADLGAGTLRQAVLDANANPGADVVEFHIAGAGVKRIDLATPLPAVSEMLFFDGTTQAGYGIAPLVEIIGPDSPLPTTGFDIQADGCVIRALAVAGFQTNISITGDGNAVQACDVGIDASGGARQNNAASGVGVRVAGSNNSIGGALLLQGNTIARNGGGGVVVQSGAFNRIGRNSMYGDSATPIDLGADGPTANDAMDADTGANALQNKPILSSASQTQSAVIISGTLLSAPNSDFRLEFFSSPVADGIAARRYLGAMTVHTDATGLANYMAALPGGADLVGQNITATAADDSGNTSELASAVNTSSAGVQPSLTVPADTQALLLTPLKLGALTLGAGSTAQLAPFGFRSILASSLSIDPTATLDLGDGALVIDGPAGDRAQALATVADAVKRARGNSNFWANPGIGSSIAAQRVAAAAPQAVGVGYRLNDDGAGQAVFTTFYGVGLDQNAVLVRYTYDGDLNLDGNVDADDVSLLIAGVNAGMSSPGWVDGDQNADGMVNADDVSLFVAGFATASQFGALPKALPVDGSVDAPVFA